VPVLAPPPCCYRLSPLPPPIDPAERAVFGQNYDALAAFNRDIFDVAQFVDRILVRSGR